MKWIERIHHRILKEEKKKQKKEEKDKLERCILKVKKQSPKVNPYAICKYSLKKKGGKK